MSYIMSYPRLIIKKRAFGFSIVELVFVLAITITLSLLALSLPQKTIEQIKVQVTANSIANLLTLSRNLAVSSSTIVIVCPSNNDIACHSDWSQKIMAFIDTNNNRRRDSHEAIIFRHTTNMDTLVNYSRSVRFLRLDPTGRINSNGSFHVCSSNRDDSLAIALVINRQGRLRFAVDVNKDGIVEGARNENVNCQLL